MSTNNKNPMQVAGGVDTDRKPRKVTKPRKEMKAALIYQLPEVMRQLKMLAVERDTTQQKLWAEALNDLFAKYGKPPIAS